MSGGGVTYDFGVFACNEVGCWSKSIDGRFYFVNDWRLPVPGYRAVVDDFGDLVRVIS